jgi:hypothetical protein
VDDGRLRRPLGAFFHYVVMYRFWAGDPDLSSERWTAVLSPSPPCNVKCLLMTAAIGGYSTRSGQESPGSNPLTVKVAARAPVSVGGLASLFRKRVGMRSGMTNYTSYPVKLQDRRPGSKPPITSGGAVCGPRKIEDRQHFLPRTLCSFKRLLITNHYNSHISPVTSPSASQRASDSNLRYSTQPQRKNAVGLVAMDCTTSKVRAESLGLLGPTIIMQWAPWTT